MSIITVPNQHLRRMAKPIIKVDEKLKQLLAKLKNELELKQNPPGLGLAFPQIDKNIRAFAMRTITEQGPSSETKIIINPIIIKHSRQTSFGLDEKNPDLEGCLSIPKIYGSVPRWVWIEFDYQLVQADQLINQHQRLENFDARIVQHELDHLNGILFTDHILKHDLPAYLENDAKELIKVQDRSLFDLY